MSVGSDPVLVEAFNQLYVHFIKQMDELMGVL